MAPDITIKSNDTQYVMRRIRRLYLSDSTVTIVMIGENTWGRRYVDWEIASSLRHGDFAGPPNGLIGILTPRRTAGTLPVRFEDNFSPDNTGYARFYKYPTTRLELMSWIDDAFRARRTRNHLIRNGRLLRERNSPIPELKANPFLRTDPFRSNPLTRRRGL